MGVARVTEPAILEAIDKIGPYYTKIAHAVGMKPAALEKRIERSKTLSAAFQAKREWFIDLAENRVFDAIKKGSLKMSVFVLRTVGKRRGYTYRDEISGPEGGPIRQAIGPDLAGESDDQIMERLAGLAKAASDLANRSFEPSPGGDSPPGPGDESIDA